MGLRRKFFQHKFADGSQFSVVDLTFVYIPIGFSETNSGSYYFVMYDSWYSTNYSKFRVMMSLYIGLPE